MMIHTIPATEKSMPISLSLPNVLLRLEGLTVFIGAIALYASQHYSGLAFVLLLLVPDVSMIGYRISLRAGSQIYNAAHVYTLPALLIALGLVLSAPIAIQIGLIWAAHIGMDRVAGYGLKYATEFKDTHMQRV
jgi:hypothetical protein